VTLYTDPPGHSVVVCLDEMGPESAKSIPGPRLGHVDPGTACRPRARQEIAYGRRGRGYIFGAFVPATGQTFTAPYRGRSTANLVAFLEHVEAWLDPAVERVYAVLDNLSAHRAPDVLLWALAHPRWEVVFQPKYAAYLNLSEPGWKVLRSLALKGRRVAASRPGTRSRRRWSARPPTGTSTGTRSSGAGGDAIGRLAAWASLPCQILH
jgi:DDE superfamily endonuclease